MSHVKNNPFTKLALNPRLAIFPALEAGARPKDMQALGRRLYASVRGASSPSSSFNALLGTGYKQVGDVNALRSAYIKQIGDLQRQMQGFAPGSPQRQALEQSLQQLRSVFKGRQNEVFSQIGTTARPRLRLADQAPKVLLAGGLTGGAGYLTGDYYGGVENRQAMRDAMADAPLMTRMRYLISPESFR